MCSTDKMLTVQTTKYTYTMKDNEHLLAIVPIMHDVMCVLAYSA